MPRDKNIFTLNPTSLDMSRSVFNRPSQLKTSFNLGDIVPIYMDEILPGDTVSMDMAEVIRMGTPIAPIMDNLYADVYFFFVPNRLVWSHWEQFCGANDVSAWTQTHDYEIPMASITYDTLAVGCLADYFGIPMIPDLQQEGPIITISELPLRAYYKIYNDFFRDENSIDPILYSIGDAENDSITYDNYPCKASRFHDLFSSCLPAPQKGSSVELPLGQLAPVITGTAYTSPTEVPLRFADTSTGSTLTSSANLILDGGETGVDDTLTGTVAAHLTPNNLWADLSKATAATVNQVRMAFQLQKLLERDARGGTRYQELLLSHFGVRGSDARLQRAEYLAGHRFRINVDQVLATAHTGEDDQNAVVGATGAVSKTAGASSLFTKSFTEHGLLIGLVVIRQDHTYSEGIEKYWTKTNRFDFYYPVLANIGEVPVYKSELCARAMNDDESQVKLGAASGVFGYQEAWYEYRYKSSRCTAFMSPSASNSLNYWTLGDVYSTVPSLSQSFLEETPAFLDRALAVGSSLTHQFIADFYFKPRYSRVMPLYSIPGLIDHH